MTWLIPKSYLLVLPISFDILQKQKPGSHSSVLEYESFKYFYNPKWKHLVTFMLNIYKK